ncbi:hypothetical protein THASP1DRAFT_32577 [Thamnocephalis sphaerospora]|uniref:Uncharacterized protein n=1 Tax=Thamnocephalis sphaerospora TaxID=78915 RepID=A0A4P9XJN1_9FUNG|nr:hypothetical protein THASP1DRAFT_32577 [Thamnocephalis sphaerospora]|eukprot:RKP05581.1 hypothetical protein THASP1DRAFT_32577 [Thamnocephalis sphaerospora]
MQYRKATWWPARLMFFLLVLVLASVAVHAELTVYDNQQTLTVATMSYLRQPAQRHNSIGSLVHWPWKNNTASCTFASALDAGQWFTKTDRSLISRSNSTALVIYWTSVGFSGDNRAARPFDAALAGCNTLAQVDAAVKRAASDFAALSLPPVTLLVFPALEHRSVPAWGPGTKTYVSSKASVPDGPPTTDVALLDHQESNKLYTALAGTRRVYSFIYLKEPGSWNKIYLSISFTFFISLLFLVVALTMLYVIARACQVAKIRGLVLDERLAVMAVSLVFSIMLLVFLLSVRDRFATCLLEKVIHLLSTVAFDSVLWYWATHAHRLHPRRSLVAFRSFLLLHTLLESAIICVRIYDLAQSTYQTRNTAAAIVIEYIAPMVPLLYALLFGPFTIWFFKLSHNVVHSCSETHSKYRMLALHTLVAEVIFIFATTEAFMLRFERTTYGGPMTAGAVAAAETMGINMHIVRAVVCLCILGIRWPQNHSIAHEIKPIPHPAYEDTSRHYEANRSIPQILKGLCVLPRSANRSRKEMNRQHRNLPYGPVMHIEHPMDAHRRPEYNDIVPQRVSVHELHKPRNVHVVHSSDHLLYKPESAVIETRSFKTVIACV